MERLAKRKIFLYSSFFLLRGLASLHCSIEYFIFKITSNTKDLLQFFMNNLEYYPKEISKKGFAYHFIA